jgi:hypothetical protein
MPNVSPKSSWSSRWTAIIVESGFEVRHVSLILSDRHSDISYTPAYLGHSVYCTYRISSSNIGPILIAQAPVVYRFGMLIFLLGSDNPCLANVIML